MAMTNGERFDEERAGKYDAWTRKTIPGYEALHDMAMFFIKTGMENAPETPRLLIAGSGTGMELSYFAERNPKWTFTGADPSREMTAIAKRRLEERGLSERAEIHTGFVHDLPESEPYDAATLILVMHFLPDDGEKLALLESISARMKPDSPFILADLHADKNSPKFPRFMETKKARQSATGMSEEDLEKWFDDLHANIHFVPEERILELLGEAGFKDVERFYNAILFGGWVARKG
ncbi:class I SAM-dependent methyltransferase [soil metagenome]|jgi:tRNA (cmo5U34)-methyltransferase|nr:class I SAM-dependent methyltransferase [Rubrobacter sp.]